MSEPLNPFWDNLFSDLNREGMTLDKIADTYGRDIIGTIFQIRDAIKEYDLQKALKIIEDVKGYY